MSKTVDSIIAEINYVTEENLLPLRKVQTADDKEKYEAEGYLPGYTWDEWKETFPKINPEHIYFLSGLNMSTVYYDKEHIIYVNMALYGRTIMFPTSEEEYEDRIVVVIKKIESRLKEKDYGFLFLGMPDGIRMDAMQHLLAYEGETPLFYKTFISQYTASNFLSKNIPNEFGNVLMKCKSKEQMATTAKRLRSLFGSEKTITVYRGEANGSTPYKDAFSWTPNIQIANFFATRLGTNGRIRIGTVQRKDIIEYFPEWCKEGSEEELLVLPGKVKLQHTIQLYDATSPEINSMLPDALAYYRVWRDTLESLYADKKSAHHDALHSLRVLFLACLIGTEENFTEQEMTDVCDAAVYHDIGRISEGLDAEHGVRSAKIYEEESLDVSRSAAFAIEAHCLDDKKAARLMKERFQPNEQKSVWRVFCVLKDADALDRVRFGVAMNRKSDALDINYLRLNFSKQLTPLAKQSLKFLEL